MRCLSDLSKVLIIFFVVRKRKRKKRKGKERERKRERIGKNARLRV